MSNLISVGIRLSDLIDECLCDTRLFSYMIRLILIENGIPAIINPLNIADGQDIYKNGIIPVEHGICTLLMYTPVGLNDMVFLCKWKSE